MNFDKNGSPTRDGQNRINPSYSETVKQSDPMWTELSPVAYSQARIYEVPSAIKKRVQENWWDKNSTFYKRWEQLRIFKSIGLESQLVGIISNITETPFLSIQDNNNDPNYFTILNNLTIPTITEQLTTKKNETPQITNDINEINGKSNVVDVSHDLTRVYNLFYNILKNVEHVSPTLISETKQLIEFISTKSGNFVPEKGHIKFKELINNLKKCLKDNSVLFNDLPEWTAVMKDDIGTVFNVNEVYVYSESGRKHQFPNQLQGYLVNGMDGGSSTVYIDTKNLKQVRFFSNIFNAVSYKVISEVVDGRIKHNVVAYTKMTGGYFFCEVYEFIGEASLNSVIALINKIPPSGDLIESFNNALRNCDTLSDVLDNIKVVGSYYFKETEHPSIVSKVISESTDLININEFLTPINFRQRKDLIDLIDNAISCRAGLKTIGDLSSSVVICNDGFIIGENGNVVKRPVDILGTIDEFCAESCLLWYLSGIIPHLPSICIQTREGYKLLKMSGDNRKILQDKLKFIYNIVFQDYRVYTKNKYLSFLDVTVRNLDKNLEDTHNNNNIGFTNSILVILKAIQQKYNNRLGSYLSNLEGIKNSVMLLIETMKDETSDQTINGIKKYLLEIQDESYLDSSSDINDLLNEFTLFSDLGTNELIYRQQKSTIGNDFLKEELTKILPQNTKITSKMLENIFDVLFFYYADYKSKSGFFQEILQNSKSFMDTTLENFATLYSSITAVGSDLKMNDKDITNTNKLLVYVKENNMGQQLIDIIEERIEDINKKINIGEKNYSELSSLFYYFVQGIKTKSRNDRNITIIDLDDSNITFIINNIKTEDLKTFLENIGILSVDEGITNWIICGDKLTVPVTLELLYNLKQYCSDNSISIVLNKHQPKLLDLDNLIKDRIVNILDNISDPVVKRPADLSTSQDFGSSTTSTKKAPKIVSDTSAQQSRIELQKIQEKLQLEREKVLLKQELTAMMDKNLRTKKNTSTKKNPKKGGGRKPKFTRRKNKNSPKRKTIKKRKMPKRKNKTRRNK